MLKRMCRSCRVRPVLPLRSAFAGFRFPREVIVLAVRWYLRYGLSYRDVEELLAERTQGLGQIGEANRCQRADQMQRGELQQCHPTGRPHSGAGGDHRPQAGNEPVNILRGHHPAVVAIGGAPATRPDRHAAFIAHPQSQPPAWFPRRKSSSSIR
jgi:hypothetical protein